MRWAIISHNAKGNPVRRGVVWTVARLRASAALANALAGNAEPITSPTDPRVEWARTAGKCRDCSIPCFTGICKGRTQATLMIRELDRRTA